MLRLRALASLLLAGTLLGAAAPARLPAQVTAGGQQGPGAAAAPGAGEQLRVYLATYGQGGAVWELFGHNSLWLQDARTGRTRSYNWGSFSFHQPGFLPRLIRGSMLYWLAVNDAEEEVAYYRDVNRSITVQELNLSPAQELELQRFVEWNALPEHMFYEYHYFRDNCSTRVRDALDRVLGGQLAQQLQAIKTRETFRSHSLRLTARAPLTYTGIELGLADSADHPLTAWEEAFVPMELMLRLRSVQVSSPGGGTPPLVASEVPLFVSSRPPPLAAAPNRVPLYLLLGVLIGLLFVLLARLSGLLEHRSRAAGRPVRAGWARWLLALSAAAWSLVVGFFGLLVLLLWTATGHTFTYGNENLLQVNPLSLLLVALVPIALLARRAGRAARLAALATASLSVLGLLLKVLPGFDQMNHDIIALMVPAHLGMLASLQLMLYRGRDMATSPAEGRRMGSHARAGMKAAPPRGEAM